MIDDGGGGLLVEEAWSGLAARTPMMSLSSPMVTVSWTGWVALRDFPSQAVTAVIVVDSRFLFHFGLVNLLWDRMDTVLDGSDTRMWQREVGCRGVGCERERPHSRSCPFVFYVCTRTL